MNLELIEAAIVMIFLFYWTYKVYRFESRIEELEFIIEQQVNKIDLLQVSKRMQDDRIDKLMWESRKKPPRYVKPNNTLVDDAKEI